MFDAGWDAGLDDAQLAAVTHGEGPLVIVAGAGTGKTRTLTARVACLLDRGVPAERILLLTFTRRAADDMLTRAAATCGDPDAARRLGGGTFHAVAHRMVAAHAAVLGLPAGLSVLDAGDAADLMDLLRVEHGLAGTDVRLPRPHTLVDVYSRAVNTHCPLRDVLAEQFPWCEPHTEAIAGVLRDYVARKRTAGLLDFDDLLLAWRTLLADAAIGASLRDRFDHVLVDEYQDVNQVQVDIVRALRPDGRGLTVVGDDAQAIYRFRGADAAHLHALTGQLPGVTVVRLERNFRSRQPLLDLANAVRPTESGPALQLRADRGGGHRPRLVRCHDAPGEARAIADDVLAAAQDGLRLRDQAVLMRAGHHSDLLEVELTARRVPFVKYGGLRFLEAAHVKDFLAALRLLDNPADEVAWFRLLRLHEGIGPARARALLATLAPTAGQVTGRHPDVVAAAPPATRTGLAATLDAIAAARGGRTVADRAAAVLRALRPLLVARYADAPARLGDLERLTAAAALAPDLAAFLVELTLDPPASTADLAGPPQRDDDYLVLSTVHSAKGLEWAVVHLLHVVDGAFPSDLALGSAAGLAEERRLFYVAVTRARDTLSIYAPLRMPHHRRARDDKHSYALASRLLDPPAIATLTVVEHGPARATNVGGAADPARAGAPGIAAAGTARIALPTLDELWT